MVLDMSRSRYYRIQTIDRDAADLLIASEQVSRDWADEESTQDGVSVCESLEDLAIYLAGPGAGIPYGGGDWAIVEIEGAYLGRGQDNGEHLVRPTAIVSIREMDDALYDMIGAAYDALTD